MQLHRSLIADAQKQVRNAALLALLFGLLSLLVGLHTWRERRHLDLELLFGILDSLVVLGLAYGLSRRSLIAALLLLGLAVLGAAYVLWRGLPVLALVPEVIAVIFYARAISALRYLHRQSPLPQA